MMKKYSRLNNLAGWLIFAIAAVTYCMTTESSASFWDCPEFITTAFKLEVGHPPGAPFFMLVANLFSQFADKAHVALAINTMSALMSAACILFLFWSITHLVRKLILHKDSTDEMTTGQLITILGSGAVGALAYAWSDTFWFSAVEAEVYAFSSLFTAVVFWLILKWEDNAENAHSDRWLIFIAYLTGLSIGVHLLNLLCIPAIVLVYYYKKNPNANLKGSLLALLASAILIVAVLYGMIPGVVKVGGWFELLMVNVLGFSFNTGVIIYIILLVAIIAWAIYTSNQDEEDLDEQQLKKHKLQIKISFLLTLAMIGLPFYGHGASSIVIGIVVLALIAAYLFSNLSAKYSISKRTINTTLLAIGMILIGYSSYTIIVIRSEANPPMDQNSPEDIFTLGSYLGREQYGTRPLFYGQTYSSKVKLKKQGNYCVPVSTPGKTKYIRKEKTKKGEKDSYVGLESNMEYAYAQNMLFPRMYSSAHANQYKNWVDIKGTNVPYDNCGEMTTVNVPTQFENLEFFFSYQLNFMYWRYFMWNFVGRQNDIQGHGEIEHGNWITGFNFIDNALVGDQTLLPDSLKNNKGHNVFYCLPLLLGLIGLFWQAYHSKRGTQQFWVVFFLFFMTGIAIVLYLNQTPMQPRERDYAYAGSFYAFAIWIGMGMAGVTQALRDVTKLKETQAAIISSVICLLVPIQMVGQTWDDHDRSGRLMVSDFGKNYLQTTQDKGYPIIYTNGDNDTFPLWYNQEVEDFRTDVRVCNLSYLQTDWYIDQMKRNAYKSPALPINWDRKDYVEGTNDYIAIRPEIAPKLDAIIAQAKANDLKRGDGKHTEVEKIEKSFGGNPHELKNILKFWARNPQEDLHIIPTDSIIFKVNREAVMKSGMKIPGNCIDSIPEYMHISLKGKGVLYKSELMMLDMLANSNWERPIYIAISVGASNMLGMENHFVQEGLAYRFTPFEITDDKDKVDTEKLYTNLMTRYKYGNLSQPNMYVDENSMRMCYSHRRLFSVLANALIEEGDTTRALKVLDYCEQQIPHTNVPDNYIGGSLDIAVAYYKLHQMDKGDAIMARIADDAMQYAMWYMSLTPRQMAISNDSLLRNLYLLNEYIKQMNNYKSPMASQYNSQFESLYQLYNNMTKQ